MEVTCRRCFRDIPAGEIDPALGFVECARCNAVFELRRDDGPPPRRPEVPMPRGVRIRRGEVDPQGGPYRGAGVGTGRLEVSLPFTRWRGLIGTLGAVFLFGVAVVLVVGPGPASDPPPLGVLVLLGLASLGLSWPGLAYLVNHRTIVIDADSIEVRNGPVPWPGRRRIAADTLKQLYVERVIYRANRGTDERYCLRTIDADGVHGTLIVLDRAPQALWLEQEIERQLGIADVPVLPRPA